MGNFAICGNCGHFYWSLEIIGNIELPIYIFSTTYYTHMYQYEW